MKKTIFILTLLLSACQFSRSVIWNLPDTGDYRKMDHVGFKPSPFPFQLKQGQLTEDAYISSLIQQITGPGSNTEAFLIVSDGKILHQYHHNQKAEQPYLCFSISKSLVATTLFIAVQEGFIHSLEDPVTMYLPELMKSDSDFSKVSISALLNMRSGISDDESMGGPSSRIAKMYYGRKIKSVLKNIKTNPDDHRFRYVNLNTQILAAVIEKSTGRKLQDYFREKLWLRLQPEHPAYWMMDNRKDSTLKAFVGFAAAPADLIRLGMLYAQGGIWQGERILKPEWVEQLQHPDTLFKYSYFRHFWSNTEVHTLPFSNDSSALSYYESHPEYTRYEKADARHYTLYRESPTFQAYGFLDQFLCINPKTGTVVLRIGGLPKDKKMNLDFLIREITERASGS